MKLSQKYKKSFLAKVKKNNRSGCWIWTASKNRDGYGKFYCGKDGVAHRYSYFLYFGPIPEGLAILHKCDNPACVNPKHLWAGTLKENTQDAISKGRFKMPPPNVGGACGQSKLTRTEVIEIRSIFKIVGSTKRIGLMYSVSSNTINNIVKRKSWKHVERQ